MRFCKLLFAIATAALLLGGLISAAAARNLRFSAPRKREMFRTVEFTGPFGTTRCDMTLEGRFHETTIAKVLETLMGLITRVDTARTCVQGGATVLAESLPWHLRYGGFFGTLPSMMSIIRLTIGFSLRATEPLGFTCLVRSTAAEPVVETFQIGAGGVVTSAELSGEIRVGGECGGARGRITGRSTTVTNETGGRITVTLI